MKKTFSFLLAMVLLVAVFPTASLAAEKSFTLMVYMCGTDLESDGGLASEDLREMVSSNVAPNGGLTVYIQTGGTKKWATNGMKNREGERWLLTKEGIERVESLGRVDMGDGDTFAAFLDYGLKQYPADRYGLIFWDHGAGASDGVCYDEISGNSLNMLEISTALTNASKAVNYHKFAMIGFDACLMADYEMAVHLQPFSDYMLASEETEPGEGWNYQNWLPLLAKDPGADIANVGKKIVDTFIQSVEKSGYGEFGTLSLLDLRKLDALRAAMEQMGASLQGEINGGNFNSISRIRQNVRSFGETSDAASDMIDLGVFATVFERFDSQGAAALREALADVVVHNRYTKNLSDITGLAVLVPYSTRSSASEYLQVYDAQNLMPGYTGFVRSLAANMGAGSYTFGSTAVTQQSVQDATIDWFSQYATDTQGYYDAFSNLWGTDTETPDSTTVPSDTGTTGTADEFALDSFLNSLFSGEGSNFNTDAFSASELWGSETTPTGNTVSSSSFANLWGTQTETQPQTVEVTSGNETYAVENPFAGATGDDAFTLQLTADDMQYLASAEANLMMDLSDDELESYVDFGYTQDVIIDWNQNKIYGLFDGTWPTLDGQMVCIYDQIANENFVRSLVPVTVNGEDTYLLVVFDEQNPGGLVVGKTEGYNDAGQPVRGYEKLNEGDTVRPQYELIYWDENDVQQSEPFDGIDITVGAGGTLPFGYEPVESDADYVYGFCLNDVFGEYQFTDFVSLRY